MNTFRSWLAVAQFLALGQIVFGLLILPAMMHSGDSAIYDQIEEGHLRPAIERWHNQQVGTAKTVMTVFGIVIFGTTTIAAFHAKKTADSAIDK